MSSPDPKASAPAPGKKKAPLVLGALVIILGAGGYVGYANLVHRTAAPSKRAPVEIDPGVVALDPFVLNLADPTGDRYFRLSVRIVLDQKSAAARAGGGLAQVKLRDRVLTVLSKKRAAQLTTVEGKEALRAEILAAVSGLLADPSFFAGSAAASGGGEGEGKSEPAPAPSTASGESGAPAHVMDVYFTEFLVQ